MDTMLYRNGSKSILLSLFENILFPQDLYIFTRSLFKGSSEVFCQLIGADGKVSIDYPYKVFKHGMKSAWMNIYECMETAYVQIGSNKD